MSPQQVRVELSLNAQQFSEAPGEAFGFYAHPHVAYLEPRCGPAAGNTTVDVRGNVFKDGSHLLCNFSSLEAFRHNHDQGAASPHLPDLTFRGLSNATLRGDDTLRCVSPLQWNTTKATTSAYGARPFEVALNGQQFTSDGVAWAWLPTAHVSFVYPASGVVGGGTVVTVTGAGFGYGCAPRCDFESVAPREWNSRHERSGRAVVNATYDAETDKLLCVAPWSSHLLATSVEVTLNGRQYTDNGRNVTIFRYWRTPPSLMEPEERAKWRSNGDEE